MVSILIVPALIHGFQANEGAPAFGDPSPIGGIESPDHRRRKCKARRIHWHALAAFGRFHEAATGFRFFQNAAAQ